MYVKNDLGIIIIRPNCKNLFYIDTYTIVSDYHQIIGFLFKLLTSLFSNYSINMKLNIEDKENHIGYLCQKHTILKNRHLRNLGVQHTQTDIPINCLHLFMLNLIIDRTFQEFDKLYLSVVNISLIPKMTIAIKNFQKIKFK